MRDVACLPQGAQAELEAATAALDAVMEEQLEAALEDADVAGNGDDDFGALRDGARARALHPVALHHNAHSRCCWAARSCACRRLRGR